MFLLGYEFNNDRLSVSAPTTRSVPVALASQYSDEKYYWEANLNKDNQSSNSANRGGTAAMRVARKSIYSLGRYCSWGVSGNGFKEALQKAADAAAKIEHEFSKAVVEGNTDLVRTTLEANDVHPDTTDEGGYTALHWAAYCGQYAVVELLLKSGYNPNATHISLYVTPLHLAASRGHVAAALLLLRSGADPNAREKMGRSFATLCPAEKKAQFSLIYQESRQLWAARHHDVKFESRASVRARLGLREE